uniref:Uncharacterized protein n=1 Tax=Myoviridae sp. ctRci5 TaxID=2825105 RepID=A0A8S5V6D9_9CAUD|nr:MAG TPA: protein of unknown function (DUF1870) [Myoviridae sp. ctRci5]
MTGAILRRLREAAGLSRGQVARASLMSLAAVENMERCGMSYSRSSRLRHPERNDRRQQGWRKHLNALRQLTGKPAQIAAKSATSAANASGSHPLPSPQNIAPQKAIEAVSRQAGVMQVEHDGAQVWVKVANHGGRDYGFVLRGREWVRSAWVEERFLGRKVTPRFREGDEAFPDTGLARWRNGY